MNSDDKMKQFLDQIHEEQQGTLRSIHFIYGFSVGVVLMTLLILFLMHIYR